MGGMRAARRIQGVQHTPEGGGANGVKGAGDAGGAKGAKGAKDAKGAKGAKWRGNAGVALTTPQPWPLNSA